MDVSPIFFASSVRRFSFAPRPRGAESGPIQRMIAAGANMMTWLAVAAEWQRDWARIDTAVSVTEVLKQHAAGNGIAYLWEQQLLNTPVPANAA